MEERKLRFTEVMLLSKILKKLNIKSYIEYLCSSKLDKMLKAISINDADENIDNTDIENMQAILALDVISWIFQNMGEADELFYKLFSSYTGEGEKAVKNFTIDKVIEVFQIMFTNGLPDVITNIIDLSDIKKKITSISEKMN